MTAVDVVRSESEVRICWGRESLFVCIRVPRAAAAAVVANPMCAALKLYFMVKFETLIRIVIFKLRKYFCGS